MQTQILHVQHRELALDKDVHHLLQRGRVRARKNAAIDPAMHRLPAIAADRMDEAETCRLQRAVNEPAEFGVVLDADMLEHADRRERVVRTGDVAVVVLDELDDVIEPLRLRPLTRERNLLAGNVERPHMHAVATRHVQRETAPAASCLHDALPGSQTQLAADMIHLGVLRFIETDLRGREIGACIRHRLAEPERIELVAQVVVVMNVVARTRQCVRRAAVQPLADSPRQ